MSRRDRLVAEERMNMRDRSMARGNGAFIDGDDDFLDEQLPVRRRRRDAFGLDDIDQQPDEVQPLDQDELADVRGPLSDYVLMEAPSRTIRNEFHRFLTSFVSETGESVYGERIRQMCQCKI